MSTYGPRGLILLALAGIVVRGETPSTSSSDGKSTPTSEGSGGGNHSSVSGGNTITASAQAKAQADSYYFGYYILMTLAALLVVLATYRFLLYSVRYVRLLTCLNNDKQRYFCLPNPGFAGVKEHLLYAPLFRQRHNEEMHLTYGLSLGVLPTRFQSLVLSGIIAMNVIFCTYGIEWSSAGSTEMLNHLRNRTGTLSIVNMIPLVVMAGRNNPLIGLLNISYNSFSLTHRWFGRIVTVEAIVHTAAWTAKQVKTGECL